MKTEIIYNKDCMEVMKLMPDKSVNFILTDIPYGEVTRETGTLSQLSNLSKLGDADKITFNLHSFLEEAYRICSNSLCIFCGREQFSEIFKFFSGKAGTTRPIVWEKTNPVPSNGKYVYLSGIEFAVWFKKKGAKVFNANCKNTVFKYPIPGGKKRIHPTQKHWDLFSELIEDNTNEGDIVFDPCAGSCVTAFCSNKLNRHWICCELSTDYFNNSVKFLKQNEINFTIE